MAKKTRFIAITSGKGGVGKSTLTANLGLMLSFSGLKVALFDADIGLANLDIMFNAPVENNILHVLKGECMLEDIILPIHRNLLLIPGESGEEIFRYADEGMFERLIANAGGLDDIDVMLLDTGAGIGEQTQRFLRSADDVIVVTVPDPAAITDAYATIKMTARYQNRIAMIMNQVHGQQEAEGIFDRMRQIADENISSALQLDLLGAISRDDKIAYTVKRRSCFVVDFPRARPTRELKMVAQSLMANIDSDVCVRADESGLSGLFRRLMEQF